MTIEVDRNLSFERTHAIAEDVEARIQAIVPGADVVIHTDPRESERETMARRIRAIAERNQIPRPQHQRPRGPRRVPTSTSTSRWTTTSPSTRPTSWPATSSRTSARSIPAIGESTPTSSRAARAIGSGLDVTAVETELVGGSG